MKKTFSILGLCSVAFLLYSMDSGAAWDFKFKPAGTRAPKTAQAAQADKPAVSAAAPGQAAADIGYNDYDGFSNVDDPLYREGSKSLLQKAVEGDKTGSRVKPAGQKSPALRDAPAALPAKTETQQQPVAQPGMAPAARRNRLIKMVPADPLKTQSGL